MLNLKGDMKINSIELCSKINEYRIEENNKELKHKNLMASIRKEIETLKSLGLRPELNFKPASYIDKQNQKRPCYELTRDSALMMLNKESTYVRYKTTEYINTLEEQISEMDKLILKSLDPNLTQEERIEIERRRAELSKERDEKASWFNDFMNSKGSYSSTQISKLFKLSSAQKLNKLLNENKIVFKQNGNWLPYANIDKTWYNLNVGTKNEHSYSQLKFTPKGIYELSKLLNIEFDEEDLKELA